MRICDHGMPSFFERMEEANALLADVARHGADLIGLRQ
jgi:hypothetical protein